MTMDGDKGTQPTDDELDVQLARRAFAMHVYRHRPPEFVAEWVLHCSDGYPHPAPWADGAIPRRSYDGVRSLPCFVGSAEGKVAMLDLLLRSATNLRIDYDTQYGESSRRGWSVTLNGRVVIQFARSYGAALAHALLSEFE